MTVREVISEAVAVSVKGLAKDRGFKKKGFAFRRTHGQTSQVIDLQLSRGNSSTEGSFYVNVGLTFDAVTALGGSTTGESVIAGETVHFSARLEDLVPSAPDSWKVTARTDAQAMGERLGAALAPVFERLEAIDSPLAMLREFPLDDGAERILRARLEYVTGDFPAALAELKLAAAYFADRRGMSVETLIERYELKKLRRLVS